MLLGQKIEIFNIKQHSFPAIYCIVNKLNGKIYIGQAVNLYRRYYDHKKHVHKKTTYLYAAMAKYGFSNFDFYVMEKVNNCNREIMNKREQRWIDKLQPFKPIGYNLRHIANSMLGFKHSDETKEKQRKRMLGSVYSDETKKKMRQAKKGEKSYWYGKKQSKSHIDKLRVSRIGRVPANAKKVVQINKENKIVKSFRSATEAAKYMKLTASAIAQAARPKSRIKTAGGYKWEYA